MIREFSSYDFGKIAYQDRLVMNTPAVEHYHTLTPLTSVNQQHNQTWHGYSSTTYKAVSAKDGRTYCLRRIHGPYSSTEYGNF